MSNSAEACVLIAADTLEILYSENCDERLSMASTTKIMTGLLLAESDMLDCETVCSLKAVSVEGSALGLRAGDKISGRDLLYGLMLRSGNDAANVIAEFLAGSNEEFAKLMNAKADQLGLKNTSFVTPSGLDDEMHYTSAYDLAVITAYALKIEAFADAVASKSATVSFGNPKKEYTISNHNKLLKSYEGCIGVKTGFTKKSGRCLVTAAGRDGKTVICVTLNDPNDWRDHELLLDYGLSNTKEYHFESESFRIPVIGGESTEIEVTAEPFSVSSSQLAADDFSIEYKVNQFVIAPIEKGYVLGSAVLKYKGLPIEEKELCAVSQIGAKVSDKIGFNDKFKRYFLTMLKSF